MPMDVKKVNTEWTPRNTDTQTTNLLKSCVSYWAEMKTVQRFWTAALRPFRGLGTLQRSDSNSVRDCLQFYTHTHTHTQQCNEPEEKVERPSRHTPMRCEA